MREAVLGEARHGSEFAMPDSWETVVPPTSHCMACVGSHCVIYQGSACLQKILVCKACLYASTSPFAVLYELLAKTGCILITY